MATQVERGITAQDVADYFLVGVDEIHGDNMTNLKLQKLLYYAQGFHLALRDGLPLFEDEIEAWNYGPAVRQVFEKYQHLGANALPRPDGFDEPPFDRETREILDEVAVVYGQFSVVRLMQLTHEEPPWRTTPINHVIDRAKMTAYFKTQLIDE